MDINSKKNGMHSRIYILNYTWHGERIMSCILLFTLFIYSGDAFILCSACLCFWVCDVNVVRAFLFKFSKVILYLSFKYILMLMPMLGCMMRVNPVTWFALANLIFIFLWLILAYYNIQRLNNSDGMMQMYMKWSMVGWLVEVE